MKLFAKLIPLYSRFVSALLPPVCLLCGYPATLPTSICRPCQQDLPILSHHCRQCAQILHGNAETPYCGACLTDPPPFARTFALFPYEQPIIQLIIKLKFQHQLSHAQALGTLLAQAIVHDWYRTEPLPDLIIPIPLHPRRLRERGFNQALEIARPIAKALHLPLDIRGVKRTRHTAAQSGLSARLRQHNIHGAFAAQRDYTGLAVVVIDDVVTTGNTMREFAKTLKAAGAKRIDVWCCARRG